jgi:hypothetical protein
VSITAFISTITVVIGLFVSGKAMLSKSELEQVFLTHEQKIKMYYYKLFGLSSLIAIFGGYLYLLWNLTINKNTTETVNWGFVIGLSFVVFICCLISLGTVIQIFQNIIIKHHYKYKVSLDNIGDVYILRMMDKDICICSKDPNADFLTNNVESILIKLDDLIQKPLIKEKLEIPKMSFWQKIMEY